MRVFTITQHEPRAAQNERRFANGLEPRSVTTARQGIEIRLVGRRPCGFGPQWKLAGGPAMMYPLGQ
jgi:hypothetical protein